MDVEPTMSKQIRRILQTEVASHRECITSVIESKMSIEIKLQLQKIVGAAVNRWFCSGE